jgi:DNA-binding transcriptional MerR regulator
LAIKYVTISKAASLIGEKTYLLKEWERDFSEFITIERDEKNARRITMDNIEILRKIKSFKDSNMDTQTIKQLLQTQNGSIATSKTQVDQGDVAEIKESLSKITAFIDSTEVQQVLEINARLNERLHELEQNVVFSISQQVNETAKLQTEVARIEFSDVQEMISTLSDASVVEREVFKEEIHRERELHKNQTDMREERFLAFIKQHQNRQERIKQGQRSTGLSFIKQFIGFAK